MTIDVERARTDTPGCADVLHFNNAGSSLPPQLVVDAQIEHLRLEAAIGGYEAADAARDKIEHVYDAAAKLVNASRNDIAIIENATRAWDMAFYSIDFQPGDRILTSKAEYASNFIPYLQMANRHGVLIDVVPNDEYGQLSVNALRDMLDDKVRLVSITHVPTNGGLVNPVQAIGDAIRDTDALFLIDACQSVGQMPIDVEKIGCHMLSTTGRKYLRGPRGTGFLYVKQDVIQQLEPPFLDLHAASWVDEDRYEIRDDARRFENWETNYAAKIGLGVAIDYAMSYGMDAIWQRVQTLAEELRSALSDMPGVTVQDIGAVRCGIVTFTVDGVDHQHIKDELAASRMHVTVSRPPSTLLDMRERGIESLVRASVHYYNTEDEIERFVGRLAEIAGRS